jgi:hypothetical protein
VAVQKHTAPQSHAAHFAASLSKSQRNHLRVLLHHEHACLDLKHALGIGKTTTVSHAEHCTGLARRADTIRLFRDAKASAANLREVR